MTQFKEALILNRSLIGSEQTLKHAFAAYRDQVVTVNLELFGQNKQF